MTDAQLPVAGSLSARLIRACPEHKTCPLTCPRRPVEDLGELGSFDQRATTSPPLRQSIQRWLARRIHPGGS